MSNATSPWPLADGAAEPVPPSRRGWLSALFGSAMRWGFGALGVASGLWAAVTTRFLMPNAVAEPPRRFKAGLPNQYPLHHVETAYQPRYGVWVVHGVYQGRRQIFALRTACTHLGCITIWQPNEQRFKCPCHGSGFSLNGIPFEGPAPRPLERCAIRIAEDGQLEVDTGRLFHQELGQWDDPDCFVET